MSEAVHSQAAAADQKDQTVREERREERAAHAQRENMTAQRDNVTAQRENPRGETARENLTAQRENLTAQRETPREAPQRETAQRDAQQRETQERETQQQRTTVPQQPHGQTQPHAQTEQRQANRFDDEWQAVQFEFVDDPHAAVRKADDLVQKAIEDLTSRHRTLSQQWKGEGKHETEDLRLALHRYRELFKSLVAVR